MANEKKKLMRIRVGIPQPNVLQVLYSVISDGTSDAIGRMNDKEFDDYWKALGTVVRLACRAKPKPQATESAPPQPVDEDHDEHGVPTAYAAH